MTTPSASLWVQTMSAQSRCSRSASPWEARPLCSWVRTPWCARPSVATWRTTLPWRGVWKSCYKEVFTVTTNVLSNETSYTVCTAMGKAFYPEASHLCGVMGFWWSWSIWQVRCHNCVRRTISMNICRISYRVAVKCYPVVPPAERKICFLLSLSVCIPQLSGTLSYKHLFLLECFDLFAVAR